MIHFNEQTPKELGYFFPAEWTKHAATWLSFPHKEASWPGKINMIFPMYIEFIKALTAGEMVCINVVDEAMKVRVTNMLVAANANLGRIKLFIHPTNDAWCRDHGPAFLINPNHHTYKKVIVDWSYNAWGEKYPPYHLDDVIPTLIGRNYQIPVFNPQLIMEGGSVDFNGKGTVLTTMACLLNENRNPQFDQNQIEHYLHNYYGVEQVLWLDEGIIGDDTDGHIDDITRFVNEDTVVTVVETDKNDENYEILQDNLKELHKMRLLNGKQLNIIELPMPQPVIYDDQRLPASYANFYIANAGVVVPTFRCENDQKAIDILERCFPNKKIIPLDSTDLIWGLGSFHCLSQQEPEV